MFLITQDKTKLALPRVVGKLALARLPALSPSLAGIVPSPPAFANGFPFLRVSPRCCTRPYRLSGIPPVNSSELTLGITAWQAFPSRTQNAPFALRVGRLSLGTQFMPLL